MKPLIQKFGAIENIGFTDRTVRAVLGLVLLVPIVLVINEATAVGWQLYTTVVSFYLLLTAMMGWDPLYAMFRVRTCGFSERSQCGTYKYEADAARGRHPHHDKGYEARGLKPGEQVDRFHYDGGSVL